MDLTKLLSVLNPISKEVSLKRGPDENGADSLIISFTLDNEKQSEPDEEGNTKRLGIISDIYLPMQIVEELDDEGNLDRQLSHMFTDRLILDLTADDFFFENGGTIEEWERYVTHLNGKLDRDMLPPDPEDEKEEAQREAFSG